MNSCTNPQRFLNFWFDSPARSSIGNDYSPSLFDEKQALRDLDLFKSIGGLPRARSSSRQVDMHLTDMRAESLPPHEGLQRFHSREHGRVSSLPSPQSSTTLQTLLRATQWPLLHWNSLCRQQNTVAAVRMQVQTSQCMSGTLWKKENAVYTASKSRRREAGISRLCDAL